MKLGDLGAIVVVNGPGSFTGVRVGLSAVKGLAEPGQIPVVAVSRLAVLAAKAGVASAALDAHRHEVFLRLGRTWQGGSCLPEQKSFPRSSERPGAAREIAVCDEAAAELLARRLARGGLVRSDLAPTAADAIELCLQRIRGPGFCRSGGTGWALSAALGCGDFWRYGDGVHEEGVRRSDSSDGGAGRGPAGGDCGRIATRSAVAALCLCFAVGSAGPAASLWLPRTRKAGRLPALWLLGLMLAGSGIGIDCCSWRISAPGRCAGAVFGAQGGARSKRRARKSCLKCGRGTGRREGFIDFWDSWKRAGGRATMLTRLRMRF